MRSAKAPPDRAAQFQRAVRALLRQPLLVAGLADEHDFRLVRIHAAELRDWFDRETGWRLMVDANGARLFKTVAELGDDTHPARDPHSGTPFGRRRYVLVCLALAILERSENQITLGGLAEQLLVAVTGPDFAGTGLHFGLERRDERADLVAVARLLLAWGVLRRVHGDEDAYLVRVGDVLYDVDRRVISGLLTGARGPSTITAMTLDERLAALVTEVRPDTDDLRNRALRHQLTRRLLEDPVVYYADLTSDELAYLHRQRVLLVNRVSEATGLVAEVRAEGIAMVDPDDELTDIKMPAQGMQSHVTLLLAELVAGRPAGVRRSELHQHTRTLIQRFQLIWRKDAAKPGNEYLLVANAMAALRALRLVDVDRLGSPDDPLVTPRPAIARYALAEPTVPDQVPRDEAPGRASRDAAPSHQEPVGALW